MLENNITIDDLARMIQKGFQETANKKDVDDKFDRLIGIVATQDDIKDIRFELKELRQTVESLTRAVDKLAKVADDLRIEYVSLANQVNRHEKWFQIIAEKLGVKLEY